MGVYWERVTAAPKKYPTGSSACRSFLLPMNGKTGFTIGAIIAIDAMNVENCSFYSVRMSTVDNGSSTHLN